MWQFPKSWPCPRAKCSLSEDSIWPRTEAKHSENKSQNKKTEEQVYKAIDFLNYRPKLKKEQRCSVKQAPWGTTNQL